VVQIVQAYMILTAELYRFEGYLYFWSKLVFLRKFLKIKTWIIFLSWSIFFIHGLVPHMHAGTHSGRHSFTFSCNHQAGIGQVKLACHCEEKGACSIQGLIFHNNSNDENLSGVTVNNNFNFTVPELRICNSQNRIIPFLSLPGNILLRGPPVK
jgi:hypothetical protein